MRIILLGVLLGLFWGFFWGFLGVSWGVDTWGGGLWSFRAKLIDRQKDIQHLHILSEPKIVKMAFI